MSVEHRGGDGGVPEQLLDAWERHAREHEAGREGMSAAVQCAGLDTCALHGTPQRLLHVLDGVPLEAEHCALVCARNPCRG